MTFRKLTLFPILLLLVFLSMSNSSYFEDNGKAGNTGSPGENTCAESGCHTSFALNSGPGLVELSSDIPATGYVPGTTYHMQYKVKQVSRALFGMGLEALTSTNANAGTLVITDAARTQIKTKTVSGVSRKNVVHKLNGGASQDSMIFTFNWTAPATNIGDVTFYFAGVAANANNNDSGDYVYSGNKTIGAQVSATQEATEISTLEVYPNPVSERLNLSYKLESSVAVQVNLYSLEGKLIRTLDSGKKAAGQQTNTFVLGNSIPKGTCLLEILTPGGRLVRKVVVR